jgi:hypothetical protein
VKIIRKKRIIQVQITPQGAVCPDGTVHTGNGSLYRAARHLISTGAHPLDVIQARREEMLCLHGTVTAFARLTWGGSDKDPRPAPWRPMAGVEVPPALAAWYGTLT